jgi:hypothetical protein
MKKNIGRIVTLAAVLALIGVMVLSIGAFASGPGSNAASQNQHMYSYGPHGAGDGKGPLLRCLDLNDDHDCGKP